MGNSCVEILSVLVGLNCPLEVLPLTEQSVTEAEEPSATAEGHKNLRLRKLFSEWNEMIARLVLSARAVPSSGSDVSGATLPNHGNNHTSATEGGKFEQGKVGATVGSPHRPTIVPPPITTQLQSGGGQAGERGVVTKRSIGEKAHLFLLTPVSVRFVSSSRRGNMRGIQ